VLLDQHDIDALNELRKMVNDWVEGGDRMKRRDGEVSVIFPGFMAEEDKVMVRVVCDGERTWTGFNLQQACLKAFADIEVLASEEDL
jgi:hypothetical protein